MDFGSILDVIQEYAERMVIEVEDAYTSAFAYNFLLTVRHTPNAIAAILPVLSKFALSIESFGDYTLNFRNSV